MVVLPHHHVVVFLPSISHPMKGFFLAVVLERVSESLIVLSIAREMRCWDGRLKSLWLFSPTKLLGVAESVAGGVLALCATQVVA